MSVSVAILEDDASLRSTIARGLREEGFIVALAVGTGRDFLDGFVNIKPDVAILDIGLPDADGRDVAMALRARGNDLPLLMLTARAKLVDRLAGFHAGIDDYMSKPFDFEELVVRVRALARRQTRSETDDGPTVVDPLTHALRSGRRSVALSPTEFRLLATLLARSSEVVRRRMLIAAAWPVGAIVQDNTLDAYVTRLRGKLRDLETDDQIQTVRGVGYRWVPCDADC